MKSWMKSSAMTLNSSSTEDATDTTMMGSTRRRYFMQQAERNPFDEKPDEDENEDFFSGSWVLFLFPFNYNHMKPVACQAN